MRRSTSGRSRPAAPRSGRVDEPGERSPLLGLPPLVGNRAMAALVAHDAAGWGFSPTVPKPPDLRLPADYVERQQEDVRARVRAHLTEQRARFEGAIRSGVSMAELVDMVMTGVPDARRLVPADLEGLLRAFFRPLDIAVHRDPVDRKGALDEIAAMARNALGPLTEGVRFGMGAGGSVTVGVSGVTAGVGARQGGRDGEHPVEVTGGWDRSVKLTTRAPGVVFEAKVSPPEQAGGDVPWEIALQFPGEDAMVPVLSALPGVFSAAERGVREAAGEARAGGAGSFDRAKRHMAPVKDAVSAVSAVAAKHSGPRFGIAVTGQGGDIGVTATLTIVF